MTKNSTTMEYQKAIDYIFQMIKDGKLIVGSKIPYERDIAEMLSLIHLSAPTRPLYIS